MGVSRCGGRNAPGSPGRILCTPFLLKAAPRSPPKGLAAVQDRDVSGTRRHPPSGPASRTGMLRRPRQHGVGGAQGGRVPKVDAKNVAVQSTRPKMVCVHRASRKQAWPPHKNSKSIVWQRACLRTENFCIRQERSKRWYTQQNWRRKTSAVPWNSRLP